MQVPRFILRLSKDSRPSLPPPPRAAGETAEDIVKAIFEAADASTEKAPQHDDMTVLVMKLSTVA